MKEGDQYISEYLTWKKKKELLMTVLKKTSCENKTV